MIIKNSVKTVGSLPNTLDDFLPFVLSREISELKLSVKIEEIRIRRNRRASIILPSGNIMLNYVANQSDINEIMTRMCKGALYAYSDTINQGYISLPDGIRVGVGGRATCECDRIIGVYDISSLCIRIPHRQKQVGAEICELLQQFNYTKGVLIYAPPGVGKTTLLRGCVGILAGGESPMRTVVIDTRGELGFSLDGEELCVDVLSGYPRRTGIEIATRCLNAQVIVCDEIGDYDEAISLTSCQNCGVPLLATAHAGSVEELICRTGIRLLHEAHVFGAYVGITRSLRGGFTYDIAMR